MIVMAPTLISSRMTTKPKLSRVLVASGSHTASKMLDHRSAFPGPADPLLMGFLNLIVYSGHMSTSSPETETDDVSCLPGLLNTWFSY